MNREPTYTYDPSAHRALVERHFTYAAGFARNTHRHAHRPALHDPATGRRWTYKIREQAAGDAAACRFEIVGSRMATR